MLRLEVSENDRERREIIDMTEYMIIAILPIITFVILIIRWLVNDTRRCSDIGLQVTHKIQKTLELFNTRDFFPARKIMKSFCEIIELYSRLPWYRRKRYKPIIQEIWNKSQILARDYFVAEDMIKIQRDLSKLGIR